MKRSRAKKPVLVLKPAELAAIRGGNGAVSINGAVSAPSVANFDF